ncbi:3-phosphoshikimate 1-carboxyvinyltransferase [bacterium]|nr:3-phosphoshikimate 1-carboxyvinyltransferase [bacterium]
MANFETKKLNSGLIGEIEIPADKSISHRSLIIGSLTKGKMKIENFSSAEDCASTLKILVELGAKIEQAGNTLHADFTSCYSAPKNVLDCGNSGTTMRLMSGILSAQNFTSTLCGDESLTKRPMKRVTVPLSEMGAHIETTEGHAPLKITGGKLSPIKYESKLASAQIKSCLMLASIAQNLPLEYTEPTLSRDHTERMLEYFGGEIKTEKLEDKVQIKFDKMELTARNLYIAGDISSAAFFIIMALVIPNSEIIIKNVGVNETRSGILDVLFDMGANIEILDKKLISGEEVASLKIKYTENLKATTVSGNIIPRLIDEIPTLALLMTQAEGVSIIKDAGDLRNKESDRLKTVHDELTKLGAKIEEKEDGLIIQGKTPLKGNATLNAYCDHRLAMTWFIAGLIAENSINIDGFEWHKTSFPEFLEKFNSLLK